MGDTTTTPAGIYLDPLYYNPDMIIDTAALSERVRHYLNYNQIRWEVFGRLVLGIGGARLSVLLGHPKPWDSLRLRVKTYYMRMLEWMDTRATYGNNPHMVCKKSVATARPLASRKKAKKIVKPRTLFQWEAIQNNIDKQRSIQRRERAALQTELDRRQEEEEKQEAIRQLVDIAGWDQANIASMNEGMASFAGIKTRKCLAKLQPADQQQQPLGIITEAFSLSGMKPGSRQPTATRISDEVLTESDNDFEEYFGDDEDSQRLTGTHIIVVEDQEEKELETEAASAQEELFNSLTGELDDIANFVDIAEMGDIDINFVKPGVFTLPSYPNITFCRLPMDPNDITESDSIIDFNNNSPNMEYAANQSPQRFPNF